MKNPPENEILLCEARRLLSINPELLSQQLSQKLPERAQGYCGVKLDNCDKLAIKVLSMQKEAFSLKKKGQLAKSENITAGKLALCNVMQKLNCKNAMGVCGKTWQ